MAWTGDRSATHQRHVTRRRRLRLCAGRIGASDRARGIRARRLQCIGFENATYDADRHNWPDLRGVAKPWPSQWCHGGPGIGLARIATARRGSLDAKLLLSDVANAIEGAENAWPHPIDTLCCGTLGAIEFWCEAGGTLNRADLCDTAARRLAAVIDTAAAAGDYRWGAGTRRFNLGLFRGLAGVAYTCLRQADQSLPNVLIWE